MGAEQSTLSAAAEEASQRADAEIEKYAEIERQKPLRSSRNKPVVEQGRVEENSPRAADSLESGEILTDSLGEPVLVPIRSVDSSQSTQSPSELLALFHPRKEKESEKQPQSEQRIEDDFVGFGNESMSQSETKKPSKKQLSLETNSDHIEVTLKKPTLNPPKSPSSARVHSTTPIMPTPKQSAPREHLAEVKRPSISALSSLGKIPKRTSVASPQSPDRCESDPLSAVGSERPPKWYKDTPYPKSRSRNGGGVDTLLSSLRTHMEKAKKSSMAPKNGALEAAFTEIRQKLHTIIFQTVNEEVLKRNFTLSNEDGLPQIFDSRYSNGVRWPFDIRADAEELYNKWCRKVFDTDMMRGINFQVAVKGSKREGGDSIIPGYKELVSAKYHGNGSLLNGQWWPFQICALRDGAHGSMQAGIFGSKGMGAFSCILSGGMDAAGHPYPDADYGETVLYCGTDSDDGTLTANTQRMLESVGNKPVRLIRSHKAHSDYKPEFGLRYDGLYDVVEANRLDPETSTRRRIRFKLVRQPEQDPIRGGKGREKRPTIQEIAEYQQHQRLSGKGKSQG